MSKPHKESVITKRKHPMMELKGLLVVIGYHDHIMIFEDPASFRRTWLSEEEFLARWHDFDSRTNAKLERFMMVLLGKEPASRAVEHMD